MVQYNRGTAVRIASGDLRRTANPPTDTSFSACGWARLDADLNAVSILWSIESGASGAGSGIYFATQADGTTLGIAYTGHSGIINLSALTIGEWFFWAITCSGSAAGTLNSYIRRQGQTSFTKVPSNDARTTFTATNTMLSSDSNGRPLTATHFNHMVWDRVLTEGELLKQSYRAAPVDRTSMNYWWPLTSKDNLQDYGPKGRPATLAVGNISNQSRSFLLPDELPPPRPVLYLLPGGSTQTKTAEDAVLLSDGLLSSLTLPAGVPYTLSMLVRNRVAGAAAVGGALLLYQGGSLLLYQGGALLLNQG